MRLALIEQSGNLINAFTSTHRADGLAYGQGATFKHNTDGTISWVDFAHSGFLGAGTETIIAFAG